MAKKEKLEKSVLTIRINNDLDEILNEICEKKRVTKAYLIRNYLHMARFVFIDRDSIKSTNDNDLILLKRSFFNDLINNFEEEEQIDMGIEIAQFINDLARLEGKIDDLDYKLDLCAQYGLFPKYIDKENYVLISNKFGPEKFVEAFTYKLVKMGSEQDFDKSWTTEQLAKSKDAKKAYKQKVNPIRRSAEHYSFEFARLEQ